MHMLVIALLVAWPVLTSAQAPPRSAGSDEAAIRAVIQAYDDAWNRKDPQGYAALFAEDGDQQISTGALRRGRAAIEGGTTASWSGVYQGTTMQTAVESIRFLTPTVALVDTSFEIAGITIGERPVRHGSRAVVLVRSGGRWQIAATRSMVPTAPGGTVR